MASIEQFIYTPIELAVSMTSTVHDTLTYLAQEGHLDEKTYAHLMNTLVVYALPNRKGYGKQLLERLFGTGYTDVNAWVFPIASISDGYKPKNNNQDSSKK